MKAKLLKQLDASLAADDPQLIETSKGYAWPEGAIIDDPKAYRLVQMGVAEPADDECKERCQMSAEDMRQAQKHQEMVAKGIQPEDYERYESGELLGYDEDGNDVTSESPI